MTTVEKPKSTAQPVQVYGRKVKQILIVYLAQLKLGLEASNLCSFSVENLN